MASFAPLRRSRGLALLVLSLPLCYWARYCSVTSQHLPTHRSNLKGCFVSAWGTARGRRVEYQARHAAPEPAEPELASPAWEESAQVVLEIVEDSTKEDALDWLQAGARTTPS